MYLRYAEPPDWTEGDYKRNTVAALNELAQVYPEHIKCRTENIPDPNSETAAFLAKVFEISELKGLGRHLTDTEPTRALRSVFRVVHSMRLYAEAELRLFAYSSFRFTCQFLAIRYLIAIELIEGVIGATPGYDPDSISGPLINPYEPEHDSIRSLCVIAAEEEISRVYNHQVASEIYERVVSEFEDAVESHFRKALPNVVDEMIFRVAAEAIVVSAPVIDKRFNWAEGDEQRFFRDILDQIMKTGRRYANARLGIKRGGRRTTEKFVWTDDRKREFFEKVSSLVHETGRPLWRYAYDELVEKDFSYRIVEWLRAETALKEVPNDLWTKAIKAWKGVASEFGRLEAAKTPEAFAMYHANHILGHPESTYSTLKKYLGQGKKLSATKIST